MPYEFSNPSGDFWRGIELWGNMTWRDPAPPAPVATPVIPKVDPAELTNVTYGRAMPLFAGGLARIGGSIIYGPYFNSGMVSFGVSFGVPVPVDGSRVLFDIALDSKIAWQSAAGATTPAGGTFLAESFTWRFYQGRLDQTVDPLETATYGAEAVAYRPQMLLFIENLPLAAFDGKVPYVAPLIGDTTDGADPDDGINLGTGMERIAHSPWAGYTSSTFDSQGITDIVPAYLFKDNFNIVELARSVTRVYRNIDLIQSDKLYFKDRGNVTADLALSEDTILAADSPLQFIRTEPSAQPRELELITIDPAQDYMPVASLSKRARDPVTVSSAVGKETITLPLVMDASTRQALVTYAHFAEENARRKMRFRALAYGLELEPGDLVTLPAVGDGIPAEIVKLISTVHDPDYTVECEAEAILKCALPSDPQYEAGNLYKSGAQVATYTFSGVDIGPEAAGRLVLISGAAFRSQSVGRDVSSITIDGVACSDLDFVVAGDGAPSANAATTVFMASMVVPTGATCTVVVNLSGAASGAFIHVTRLTELGSTTPVDDDSATSNASDPTLTIDVPDNGIAIAVYAGAGTNGVTWTGLSTENADQIMEPGSQWRGSIASQGSLLSQTGRTITATTSNTGHEAIMVRTYA